MRKMRNWRVKIKIEERIVFVVVRKGRDLRKERVEKEVSTGRIDAEEEKEESQNEEDGE